LYVVALLLGMSCSVLVCLGSLMASLGRLLLLIAELHKQCLHFGRLGGHYGLYKLEHIHVAG